MTTFYFISDFFRFITKADEVSRSDKKLAKARLFKAGISDLKALKENLVEFLFVSNMAL